MDIETNSFLLLPQGLEMSYRITMTNGYSYWYKHFSADEFCEYCNDLFHALTHSLTHRFSIITFHSQILTHNPSRTILHSYFLIDSLSLTDFHLQIHSRTHIYVPGRNFVMDLYFSIPIFSTYHFLSPRHPEDQPSGPCAPAWCCIPFPPRLR